jgi:hypothetical protein
MNILYGHVYETFGFLPEKLRLNQLFPVLLESRSNSEKSLASYNDNVLIVSLECARLVWAKLIVVLPAHALQYFLAH